MLNLMFIALIYCNVMCVTMMVTVKLSAAPVPVCSSEMLQYFFVI